MLLKTSEVALILRVSTRRVAQLVELGRLAPVRIGDKALRYRVSDIAELTQQTPEEIMQAVLILSGQQAKKEVCQ